MAEQEAVSGAPAEYMREVDSCVAGSLVHVSAEGKVDHYFESAFSVEMLRELRERGEAKTYYREILVCPICDKLFRFSILLSEIGKKNKAKE